ncbi:MAG: hypothetical protein ACOYKI_03380 [Sediminibacterium sp.]
MKLYSEEQINQILELRYKEKIDLLTPKRDMELDKLLNMLKSNSDRDKIENQFETLMRKQELLSSTIGDLQELLSSTIGALNNI